MSTLLHIILHIELNNRDLGPSKGKTIAGGLSGRGLESMKGPIAGESILNKPRKELHGYPCRKLSDHELAVGS